ncbi:MAG TPA: helix-turn-helix domain-containing protein [Patescibacteria group bacterium]|nr:helix-turn-helix domain-containing protein [Patescibacteria group bacterium]
MLDVHISKLRKKLDGPDEPRMLENVRGIGFILRIPD